MSEWNITVEGGASKRLLTAGKYCDRDILITATGGGGLDTSDATATEKEIVLGYSGYARGKKIAGINPYAMEATDAEVAEQDALLDLAIAALEGKAAGGGGSTEPDNRALYQRVESITSDGESYVITDFIADNSSGMEMVASFPTLVDRPPMGSRTDTGATRFYCVYPLSANSCYYGFNNGATISCPLTAETIYRLQTNFMNSRLVNIVAENGVRKGGTSISGTLAQQNVPVAIFGYYHGGTKAINSIREFTLYSARISAGNDIVREYIPCYRKSDGVVGLYEKFTGEFLTTPEGDFTAGKAIEWGV